MDDRSVEAGNGENSAEISAPKANGDVSGPTATPGEAEPPQPTLGTPENVTRQSADALMSRWKKLLKLKKEFSSPFAVPIAVVFGASSLYQFIIGWGTLSYPVLGFAAVSLLALLVPEGAPRLFAMRTFAFAMDILLLGVLTVAILPAYQGRGGPSEFTITFVVWLWLIYFVFFDWQFHGTPGKRMLGLRLVVQRAKFNLLTVSLRTFLTLFVPVVGGVLVGNLFTTRVSRIGFAAAYWVRGTFLLAIPVSILVLGGNRGFADRVMRTEVRLGRRTARSSHRNVTLRSWVLASTLPFIGGFAIAIFGYTFTGIMFPRNSSFHVPAKPTGTEVNAGLFWSDPKGIFKADCLAPGFRHLSKEVLSVDMETVSNNPFTAKDTDIVVNPMDVANLQKAHGLSVLQITTTSWVSPAAYMLIMRNLARCYGPNLDEGKHGTFVIQFLQRDEYGFFFTIRSRSTVLGVDEKSSTAYYSVADLQPKSEGVMGARHTRRYLCSFFFWS